MLDMSSSENLILDIHKKLSAADIDYRFTGIVAANIYGFILGTNVIEIVVESDSVVLSAVKALELSENKYNDPYVCYLEEQHGNCYGVIKIQGDIMGEAFILEDCGIKLHDKKLLLDRLGIYGINDGRVLEAASYIALTLDDDKIEKHKEIWNKIS